jgi:hypothetical protein
VQSCEAAGVLSGGARRLMPGLREAALCSAVRADDQPPADPSPCRILQGILDQPIGRCSSAGRGTFWTEYLPAFWPIPRRGHPESTAWRPRGRNPVARDGRRDPSVNGHTREAPMTPLWRWRTLGADNPCSRLIAVLTDPYRRDGSPACGLSDLRPSADGRLSESAHTYR